MQRARLGCWQALSPEQKRRFPPLCPDLVVELASSSDAGRRGLQALRQRMELYQLHGARLGWLIIPHFSQVEVWMGSGSTPELLSRR